DPVGSSRPRRRSARCTVEVDPWCPSARIIAAILRCPHAGQSTAYLSRGRLDVVDLGAGHGPSTGHQPDAEPDAGGRCVRAYRPGGRTSKPASSVPLSWLRGHRRDILERLIVPEGGLRRLLATCAGKRFEDRRDTA